MTDEEAAQWCRGTFDRLADGGTWAIPRSGMIFQKSGNTLVLTCQMPYAEEMPITEAQFNEQQEREFDGVKENFGRAGIAVRRS
jgi:hypothetical protein